MKIIFLQECPPYHKGEVQNVADGYARNYLIPNKLAQLATESGIQENEKRVAKQKLEKDNFTEALKKALESIQNKSIKIFAKSSDHGTLYAAISSEKIAEELSKKNDLILPKELIRQLPQIKIRGEYPIKLQYEGKEYSFIIQV
jgi:large subunit ribosomal protein L9